jgi:D-tagatose-1,6-bisphosphate aldolase subunit GatZ/KbaZ
MASDGDPFDDVIRQHKAGAAVGIASICSAHPLVIEAAVRNAVQHDSAALIEATSNQVDQDGGYTGMRPADFRGLVMGIAADRGLPASRVVLGGDHLGPNRWRHLPPDEAMEHADELVRAYVAAGFTKIHIDCTFPCAGDPPVLSDAIVSERAARLIAIAEHTATEGPAAIRYVIGTEVPIPGGEQSGLESLAPTSPAAARETLGAHRSALEARDLMEVWPRVVALVVQPGVDFDGSRVVAYERAQASGLPEVLADEPSMVFEAHSTDYQTLESLRELVEDHWAILKVGPGLTFALREAMFALAEIEAELVPGPQQSRLPEVIEARMLAEPGYWQGYYDGNERDQKIARRYSYSDRLRYYWPSPDVVAAQEKLFSNLTASDVPLTMLSQFLPLQYDRVRRGELSPDPHSLVIDRITDVLRVYAAACGTTP